MSERMSISDVRKMTKTRTWSWEAHLPPQRVTLRCADCKWHQRNVLLEESTRLYMGHRELRHAS